MWRQRFQSWTGRLKGKSSVVLSSVKIRLQNRLPKRPRFRLGRFLGRGDIVPSLPPPSLTSAKISETNRSRKLTSHVRVVTDIDDTVKSSGGLKFMGIHLGGVDRRLKRGEFYPGAVQFAYELSSYGGPYVTNVVPSTVAVLTARAKELKFALALRPSGKLCSMYQSIGSIHGNPQWGIERVYYGSLLEWLFQNRKGIRKFSNFEKLLEDDINAGLSLKYVLIGDTGEKDEDAAERIVAKYPERIRVIFLHAVAADLEKSFPQDRVVNGVNFYYFKTYVGAASKAYECDMIDKDGLERVLDHANRELGPILSRRFSPFRLRRKLNLWEIKDELRHDTVMAMKLLRDLK